MLPFGIGFGEIVIVCIVLIVFVGPEGIPQAVRSIAKVIRTIRAFVDEVRYSPEFDEVKREILDPLNEARRFNPGAQARQWVRDEVERPIQESITELTQPQSPAASSAPASSSPASSSPASSSPASSSPASSSLPEEPPELDDPDELEDSLTPISAQDPLERDLPSTPS